MEDKEQRTEEPTGKQIQKFREEGQVAVSRELVGLAVLIVASAVAYLVFTTAGMRLAQGSKTLLGNLHEAVNTGSGPLVSPLIGGLVWLIMPIALAAAFAAIITTVAQTKGLFTLKVLRPKFSKFNPVPKLKEMFFSKTAAMSLLQSVGKIAVIIACSFDVFWAELQGMVGIGQRTPVEILAHLASAIGYFLLRVVMVLIAFAIIDFVWVHRRMHERMKMTKKQVEDERKESEGNPEVKGKVRSKQRSMHRHRMMAQVPGSDVVLVNPTHYAVALRYDGATMAAPEVTAKGKDEVAASIRKLAREHRIPVLHNPPLARKLFADVEVGNPIPERLFAAIAEVLALVYRIKQRIV